MTAPETGGRTPGRQSVTRIPLPGRESPGGAPSREQLSYTVIGRMARLMQTAARNGDLATLNALAAEIEELYDRERRAALVAEQRARSERARAVEDRLRASAELARAQAMMTDVAELRERVNEHRKQAAPVVPASDVAGTDMRPDPSLARTPAEFIEALRQFKIWAGNPSYRNMEDACGGRPVASTMCKVLRQDRLPPRFEAVAAILQACGAGEEDRQRFWTAWRRLTMTRRASVQAAAGKLRSVPRPRTDAKPA